MVFVRLKFIIWFNKGVMMMMMNGEPKKRGETISNHRKDTRDVFSYGFIFLLFV